MGVPAVSKNLKKDIRLVQLLRDGISNIYSNRKLCSILCKCEEIIPVYSERLGDSYLSRFVNKHSVSVHIHFPE